MGLDRMVRAIAPISSRQTLANDHAAICHRVALLMQQAAGTLVFAVFCVLYFAPTSPALAVQLHLLPTD